MAAVRLPGQPWRVTCDLCEQTRLELDGDLSVDALGEAIREAGWIMPVYGGTFERECYNRMRLLTGQPPIPEPDPVADLLATVTKVRNTLFHALGIEPDRRPQLAPQLPAGWRAECDDCPGVREPDYGALVYPGAEFEDTDEHLDVKLLDALFPQRVMLGTNPSCQHRMIANSTGQCVACGEQMEAVTYQPEYVTSAPNAAAGLCSNGPDCDGGEGCTAVYVPDTRRAVQVHIGTDVLYQCRRCSNNGTIITAGDPIEWDCGHDHRGDRLPAQR